MNKSHEVKFVIAISKNPAPPPKIDQLFPSGTPSKKKFQITSSTKLLESVYLCLLQRGGNRNYDNLRAMSTFKV